MSLIPKETLDVGYWAHKCEAKNDSIVYTQNGDQCYLCGKTVTEAGSRVINSTANTAG